MTKPISPLRQRMIDDMAIRNMSPNTQNIYISAVARFSAYHRRSPDKLGLEDIRDYHLNLVSRKLKPTTINPIMGALRFFYGKTLGQKHIVDEIPYALRADSLPAVLSREEVERFLKTVHNLKMRTAFITIYAAGLRVSELVALTIGSEPSRPTGSFPAPILCNRLPPDRCNGSSTTLPRRPASIKCHRAHAATQLRDASAGTEGRHSRHSGIAWPSQHQFDDPLYPRRGGYDPTDSEPTRTAEHRIAADLNRRPCQNRSWRWRTSSVATATRGVRPMLAI